MVVFGLTIIMTLEEGGRRICVKVTVILVNIPVAVSRQARTADMCEGHNQIGQPDMCEGHNQIGQHSCSGKSAKKTADMCEGQNYIGQHSCRGKSAKEDGGHV